MTSFATAMPETLIVVISVQYSQNFPDCGGNLSTLISSKLEAMLSTTQDHTATADKTLDDPATNSATVNRLMTAMVYQAHVALSTSRIPL